jgi:hypothetical protein
VCFIAPADIYGTNILIHEHGGGDDDSWIYLPSMKMVRRLLANNRKGSFMGTDLHELPGQGAMSMKISGKMMLIVLILLIWLHPVP